MVDLEQFASLVDELEADPGSRLDPRLRALFGDLIDQQHGAIGRVVASEQEPAGSHSFYFWANEEQRSLDVGHIVVGFSEDAAVIGVVDEPRRYSDLRSFLDDFYDRQIEEAIESQTISKRPEILVFEVTVLRTKHERDDVDSHRPVIAGPVYYATREAIDYALGKHEFAGAPIAALLHTNGNYERDEVGNVLVDEKGYDVFQRSPIWIDEHYLLGPEAGHANWTGQSGLATKTSHVQFLTSAVFQRMRGEGKKVAALMFNVKGADLIWLDKSAVPDDELRDAYDAAKFKPLSDADLEAYDALDLEIEPFTNLRIFAPFKPGQQPSTDKVMLGSFGEKSRLNTLRDNPAETSCLYPVLWSIRPLLAMPHKVFERNDLDDKMWGLISELRDDQRITSLKSLLKRLDEALMEIEENGGSEWHGHHKFTILKAKNRFYGLPSKFGGLVTEGEVDFGNLPQVDSSFTDQEVRVVDIAHCNSNVQELLVASTVNRLWQLAERDELGVDKLIIFVDELNKYAPGGSEGALRDTLVDIAARGRHLNVVLFGAQQFRSKVESEILGNCGTSFYGRIGDEEIINSSYRSLSETTKSELLGLRKGRLLIRHAHFRSPLFGSFPRPPVISGSEGQRVFNDPKRIVGSNGNLANAGVSNPSDALYFLLKRLSPDERINRGIVRTEAEGLTDAQVQQICLSVEQQWNKIRDTSAARRMTPWTIIKHQIQEAKRMNSLG
ncbi:MAG: ATP-binding protein [Thermomicrobiales bacterium]|nr:ATP-binding protein [Thermomicrobiales bacterium]MCO5220500.1 hypothetical protein [Thermomicrobiales bacterium]